MQTNPIWEKAGEVIADGRIFVYQGQPQQAGPLNAQSRNGAKLLDKTGVRR